MKIKNQNAKIKISGQNLKIRTFSFLLVFLTFTFALFPSPTYAIVDPLAVPNNKYGIHILTDSKQDAEGAAGLVNSSGGDWG